MYLLFPFLSVVFGFIIAFYLQPKNKQNIKLLLAFSGSFLLSQTVIHLLPEVYILKNNSTGIFIMIGILFQIILEFFSKGAEHGHVHGDKQMNQIPISLFISLCIHAFFEGIPVAKHNNLGYGIAIHHLPIALILTTFFINSNLKTSKIVAFMFIFAIMTPLGTILSTEIKFLEQYFTQITAVVIGILFHIGSTIIFESSEGHKFNIAKTSVIIIGIALAYFI